ncbi:esophageal gland cell secretory protein 21 [Aphelenchoides avenae]|nr:esophageal gland cell secretory protein 21 [Aphelenchus avenae]
MSSTLRVLTIFACVVHCYGDAQSGKDELLLVQAVMRHGSRSPTSTFPTDPYREDFWPQGFGELSGEGLKQQFELGRFVRERYVQKIPFLSKNYNSREVYFRSTDLNRTILSAQAHATGVYAGSGRRDIDYPDVAGWPKGYVPVPVHVIPTRYDPVSMALAGCPRAAYLERVASSTPEMLQLGQEHQELFANFSQRMGLNVTLSGITGQIDSLQIETELGLKVADWVPQLLPTANSVSNKRLRVLYGYDLRSSNETLATEIAKVRGGLMLWEMLARFDAKRNCTEQCLGQTTCSCYPSKLKYYLYSSHYDTMTGVLFTLGSSKLDIDRDELPPDSSSLFFELWRRSSGAYYLKVVYYRDGQLHDITSKVAGCSSRCDLDTFLQRSEKFRPLPSVEALCAKNTEL